MEFRLFYRGPLKSNGGPDQKQAIRRYFHKQLQKLWKQVPLKDFGDFLNPNPKQGEITLVEKVGDFQFVPLVSERIHLIAEIDILFLRPEEPGAIVTQSGDIDNRLKTLFDSLRMPKDKTEIPKGDNPKEGETPFFCVLQDDFLITSFSVISDRLLVEANPSEVVLIIEVRVDVTRTIWKNIGLGG